MSKKLDELTNPPRDPNSPESQEFLRKLQKEILIHREKMRRIYQEWVEEDRRNEIK